MSTNKEYNPFRTIRRRKYSESKSALEKIDEILRALPDYDGANGRNIALIGQGLDLVPRNPITNRYNQDQMVEDFERRNGRTSHDDENLYIAFSDIDDFKVFNDQYGHAVGDRVLAFTCSIAERSFREYDATSYHFHGEEKGFLIRARNDEDAVMVMERYRNNILLESDNFGYQVTESIGLTKVEKGEDLETALNRADRITKRFAKEQGKNCVVFMTRNNYNEFSEEFDDITEDTLLIKHDGPEETS
jgi:diguanylate cyclase (GGDEF)-like protein